MLTYLQKMSTCPYAVYFFGLLVDLGINIKGYQMEKVKWHLGKWFGDRLEFYQAHNRSLPCVVDAANLLAAQVAQLLNVAENEESMHTLSDESDCQLDESCSKGNATALRINELVRYTYHVARTLHQEVFDMKLHSGLLLLLMFPRLRSQARFPTCCTISLHGSCENTVPPPTSAI